LLLLAAGVQAATVVRINDVGPIQPGDTITVPVTLDSVSAGLDIVGFDFLIAWESFAFRFVDAQPGQLLADCGWEYFNVREGNLEDWDGAPIDLPTVRIVSLADINNGPIHPTCNATSPGELVQLVLEASSHPSNYGTQRPLRFLWADCGDNGMALFDGSLIVSDRVFDDGWDWSQDGGFPTWFGAPDTCLSGGAVREVDFYNGIVTFADPGPGDADAEIAIIGEQYSWLGWPVSAQIVAQNVAAPFEAGGFDLLMHYDPTGLTLTSVSQGTLLTGCDWEYFTYRGTPDSGLVRVVALAETNNGGVHPSCNLAQDGELAMLHFEVVNSVDNIGRELPIEFIWNECGDNVLANPAGDSLYASNDVYDPFGFLVTADDTLPTTHGAPDACLTAPTVRRSVNFFSGMISVATTNPEVSDRGDINLNGIAYEIADFIIFSDYFFYGLSVFTVNIEAQVAATDVNADGLTLTFNDLAYMYRVMVGDASPIWSKAGADMDTAFVIQDTTAQTLSLSYSGSVTMLMLDFNGFVEVGAYDSIEILVLSANEGHTRMIIFPGFGGGSGERLLPSGHLLDYTGNGLLVSAVAAYDGITPVPAMPQISGGSGSCCIARGNVNHDPEGQVDITDLVYFVSYAFAYGPPPPCLDEADVTGDSHLDIADIVYLIDYMFVGGDAPVPCQ